MAEEAVMIDKVFVFTPENFGALNTVNGPIPFEVGIERTVYVNEVLVKPVDRTVNVPLYVNGVTPET